MYVIEVTFSLRELVYVLFIVNFRLFITKFKLQVFIIVHFITFVKDLMSLVGNMYNHVYKLTNNLNCM